MMRVRARESWPWLGSRKTRRRSVQPEPGERGKNGCWHPGSRLRLRNQTRKNGPGGLGRRILAEVIHAPIYQVKV
jgi:hypothetical protein